MEARGVTGIMEETKGSERTMKGRRGIEEWGRKIERWRGMGGGWIGE